MEASRVLVEAGASVEAIPRGQDGSQLSLSLARLAASMARGDLVSLLAGALVKRDSAECWMRDWSSGVGGPMGYIGRLARSDAASDEVVEGFLSSGAGEAVRRF